MKVRRIATASGSAIASGLTISTSSCSVSSAPTFAFAAKESGRSFTCTRVPGGSSAGTLPGMFAITSSSSTCGASGGSERLQLRRVAVRDDDGADLHASA